MFLLLFFSLKIVNRNVYGLDHTGATLNFQGQPGLLTGAGPTEGAECGRAPQGTPHSSLGLVCFDKSRR